MISVVIPAYNEEISVEKTINEIVDVLKKMKLKKYEIVLVDDGSTDNTKMKAKNLGAVVLSNPENIGYGFSLKRGIEKAKYNTIIIIDADQTYPVDEIPKLYKEYQKGFDMVVGQRTGSFFFESPLKFFLRRLLKFTVEFAATKKIPDINSGLRIFDKDTIKTFFPHLSDTFSFTTSSTLAYIMNKKFVSFVPIKYKKRAGNSKVRLFKDSLKTSLGIIQSITYYNPMRIFILFSATCIFFSLLGFLASIFLNLTSGFYLGIGGLLLSLLILSIGLLADLLKQIMDQIK
jgi:glycosyltransferase involved in cell wall biosynthesis